MKIDLFAQNAIEVMDWDVIVCGHLKWNRYFGESAQDPPRGDPSTCGSALIVGNAPDGGVYRLLVDPTLRRSREEYDFDLNRRTGLHVQDITHCFSTHHHADHVLGLRYFSNAVWFAAPGEIPLVQQQDIRERLRPAQGEFLPGAFAVALPGHTEGLCGVAFKAAGKRILIAGDAVMSRHHFARRTTEFQQDPKLVAQAARTIERIAEQFDIVLPGHDNPIYI